MKIPPQAKSVFKGKIFEIFQWDQEMFDGSTATFEMLKRPSTSQIIATRNNKILIVDEEQPNTPLYTGIFGGRQEPDEDALACAKRELLEEGGLVSDSWQHFQTYTFAGKIDWKITLFIAKNVSISAKPNLDVGEKITFREVEFDEFVDLVTNNYQEFGQFAFDLLYWKFVESTKLAEFKSKLGLT